MTTDKPPTVRVKRANLSNGTWTIDCPHCGREHTHSAGPGHRVAHCHGDNPGYVIGHLVPGDAT